MISDFMDHLESRVMFDGGPVVTSTLFVGDHNEITGLVVAFDRAMDPATAGNRDNYRLIGRRNGGRMQTLPFAAATYDPATFSVSLTRTDLFSLRFFRRMRVIIDARTAGEVSDATGALLDGDRDGAAGGDSVVTYRAQRGRGLSYRDEDGDRVKLKARGAEGGRPLFTLAVNKQNVHQAWLDGFGNTLTGTINPTRRSDGVTSIGRVVLVHPSNTNALSSSFIVGQTVADGQAPVNPLIRTF